MEATPVTTFKLLLLSVLIAVLGAVIITQPVDLYLSEPAGLSGAMRTLIGAIIGFLWGLLYAPRIAKWILMIK